MIRPAHPADAPAIAAVYNHYVLHTPITFEEEAVSGDEIVARLQEVQAGLPWLVAEHEGVVIGYAYASRWKSRCAYRYAVETTVYVDQAARGAGVGSKLYQALVGDLRGRSMHSLIGGIALPNAASVALHEKFGFRKVAHFEQVGWKFKQWIDVGYWELILAGGPPAPPAT
jgi:phosphinothricin acetyltransferase